jgi:hypothetical protein
LRAPAKVYRFLEESEHADQLCAGHVWLSTLSRCRSYESAARGDPEEGTQTYSTGAEPITTEHPHFREMAARVGIDTDGSGTGSMTNCRAIVSLPDAFVLCTTLKYSSEILSKDFGDHCVEISHPRSFFALVTQSLARATAIREAKMGPVKYASRCFSGMEDPPGQLGFVKAPDAYELQQEYRFLWVPPSARPLVPSSVYVRGISNLCRRVA